MKIALSTYSLSALTDQGKLTQLGCIAKAKEMGFDAVEIVGIWPHDGSSPEEYASKLAAECRRLDIPVSNYATSADFLRCADLEQEIARVKHEVDIAAILGSPCIRHDVTIGYPENSPEKYAGFGSALNRLAYACRSVTEYAAGKGIVTVTENHGWFLQESTRIEQLINAVGNSNFGYLCDIGNFMDAEQDPVLSCSRLAGYVRYVHAKDFHFKSGSEPAPGYGYWPTRGGNLLRGAVLGHGVVPVRQCMEILMRAGFDGTVSIEFEGIEEPEFAVKLSLQNLRRYLEEAEQRIALTQD